VATLVNNLGGVLQDLGERVGARAAFERALAIDERVYGPEHPEVARDVNNLGRVLQDLGDLAGARAACERALAILEKFLPADHPHIRIVRGNLEGLGRAARGEE
jgi:tetratricopeptide (TPR) repeat protein